MDIAYALAQCHEWLRLHEIVPLPENPERKPGERKSAMRGTKEERARINNIVSLVAQALYEPSGSRWWADADGVRRLVFELEEGLEVRGRLGITDPGPTLIADSLHPWVWQAARSHWEGGNHDAAVWAAAIRVNSALQAKAERPDIGETRLVGEAFSLDPPSEGRPRLRLCGRSNPDLFKDRHVGASNLGKGLFMGVRNPLNHVGAVDLGEQEALETLASWSLLARWIDRAEVLREESADI